MFCLLVFKHFRFVSMGTDLLLGVPSGQQRNCSFWHLYFSLTDVAADNWMFDQINILVDKTQITQLRVGQLLFPSLPTLTAQLL